MFNRLQQIKFTTSRFAAPVAAASILGNVGIAVAAFHSEESAFAETYFRAAAAPSDNTMTIALLMLLGGTLYICWRFIITLLGRIGFVRRLFERFVPDNEPALTMKRGAAVRDERSHAVNSQES